MKKIISLLVVSAFLFTLVPVNLAVADSVNGEVRLMAGQHHEVGKVTVMNDEDYLYVKYEITEEGWCITETHVHAWKDDKDEPTNRAGNPVPGQFAYKAKHDPCVEDYYTEIIPLGDWKAGDDLKIAAHAVVEKIECEILNKAPYGGSSVYDYKQGSRKNKTSVREGRSDPDAALTYDLGQDETNFFSLGFKFDKDGNALPEGGWIIVEFEHPVLNKEGNDILVVEDTWGTYPIETADVYASQDAETWYYLGEADNLERDPIYGYHTVTYFDLEDVGLDWAKYVKVVDTTPIGPMPNDGDGYDLNVVLALHDYEVCETYNETAWADGERFTQRGSWATYFMYTLERYYKFVETLEVTPYGENPYNYNPTYSSDLPVGKYRLIAIGTYRFANWGDYGIADALYNYRRAQNAPGGEAGWYIQDSQRLQVWMFGYSVDWRNIEDGTKKFNPDHVYFYEFDHNGGEIEFGIEDDYYDDNSGFITVDIYKILP